MWSDPGYLGFICDAVFIGPQNVSLDERGTGTPHKNAASSTTSTTAAEPEIVRNKFRTT